jgi:hypothetical protein
MKKIVLGSLVVSSALFGDWMDIAKSFLGKEEPKQEVSAPEQKVDPLTQLAGVDLTSLGLQDALNIGVDQASKVLGAQDGFLNSKEAKIGLPSSLESIASVVKSVGGEQYIQSLEKSMNSAASEAVVPMADIFKKSIANMSMEDGANVLKGGDGALTNYFKKENYEELLSVVSPIVKKYMDENSVTKYYQTLMDYYEQNKGSIPFANELTGLAKQFGVDKMVPTDVESLQQYISEGAINGMLGMMEQEESKIRQNPMGYSSDAIQKVFGKI